MKITSKLYLFFTSLMFLFSPLSLGLAAIYFDFNNDNMHIPGLLVNIILLLILLLIIVLLIKNKKIEFPNLIEKKFLLFGLLSNVVIYFYVFQNSLVIEKFITIYIITVLILLLYYFIISKRPIIYELWMFGIWFFIMDTIHYQYVYTERYYSSYVDINFFQHAFYLTIPILTFSLFIYAIYKYKALDVFTKIAVGIVLLSSVIIFDFMDMDSKYMLTLNLILPFVIIADFITMLIYKRFNILKVPFYIRLYTVMILMIYYAEEGLLQSKTYSNEALYEMVAILYVALICNLIVFLIPKKLEKDELNDEIQEVKENLETLISIDLNSLTITTLKALAKAKGIEGYTKLEKDEIIKLLT